MHFTMLMQILKQMLHLVVTIVVSISWISVFMALPNLSRSEAHEPKNKSIDYMEDEKYKSYCIQEILIVLLSITIFFAALKISSKNNLLTRIRNLLNRLLNYFRATSDQEILTDNQQVINTDQEVTIYQRNLEDRTDLDEHAIPGSDKKTLLEKVAANNFLLQLSISCMNVAWTVEDVQKFPKYFESCDTK